MDTVKRPDAASPQAEGRPCIECAALIVNHILSEHAGAKGLNTLVMALAVVLAADDEVHAGLDQILAGLPDHLRGEVGRLRADRVVVSLMTTGTQRH